MKRPLNVRLTTLFGEQRVADELRRMLRNDPTKYLNEDGQQELFERLCADHRMTRRFNAASRAHYAKQQQKQQQGQS
jgi:hypothetical protein